MSDHHSTQARGPKANQQVDGDVVDSPLIPPESRVNEKTDILPAIESTREPRREEYSRKRHPSWVPAPTTVDHGPANRPASQFAVAAKMIVVFLILLAVAGAALLLFKSI